jgi:hypothetical protein
MIRFLLVLLSALFVIDAAYAQAKRPLTAAEMQALLGNGLSVSSRDIEGGKHFTANVNLEPGGRLTGSMNVAGHGKIALNGTWRLQGAQVCRTLGPAQPEVVCETWLRAGNAKEVTIVVDGKEVSVNRWQ